MIRFLLVLGLSVLIGCSSPARVAQGDSPAYASAYPTDARVVGDHDLDALASAPLRTAVRVHFDHPPEHAFRYLLTEVDLYDDSIVEVTFDHSGSETPGEFGVGSVRTCVFENGKALVEPIVVYQPYAYYAYTVDPERSTFSVPVRDVLLFYQFEGRPSADGRPDGSALVTVRAHYTPSVGVASPVIRGVFNRTIAKTFATAADRFSGRLIDTAR